MLQDPAAAERSRSFRSDHDVRTLADQDVRTLSNEFEHSLGSAGNTIVSVHYIGETTAQIGRYRLVPGLPSPSTDCPGFAGRVGWGRGRPVTGRNGLLGRSYRTRVTDPLLEPRFCAHGKSPIGTVRLLPAQHQLGEDQLLVARSPSEA